MKGYGHVFTGLPNQSYEPRRPFLAKCLVEEDLVTGRSFHFDGLSRARQALTKYDIADISDSHAGRRIRDVETLVIDEVSMVSRREYTRRGTFCYTGLVSVETDGRQNLSPRACGQPGCPIKLKPSQLREAAQILRNLAGKATNPEQKQSLLNKAALGDTLANLAEKRQQSAAQ